MRKKQRVTAKELEKRKVPKVLIAGLLIAAALGWTGWRKLTDTTNYYQIKTIFPVKTTVTGTLDGDTMVIGNGLTLRLVGIDAPGRGEEKYEEAKDYLSSLVSGKQVALEYDTYQDDKFGRILAYAWISCMQEIIEYCRDDRTLVNEVMIKKGYAKKVVYEKRKKLKYDAYLGQ